MKLYKENGYLSEFGEKTFKLFLDKEIESLLKESKSESELRLIGSLIQKRVGDLVSDHSLKFRK